MATKKSDLKAKDIDIAIIGADAYYAVCHLKETQIFVLSIRDIQYQAKKKARAETNPISIVPQEYHDFLDDFSKKDLDTLLSHQKYDHKIHLKEEQKLGYALLYKIFS